MLPKRIFAVLVVAGLFAGCTHKKYETPIAKNTQQPDKVLFDSAMKDIEHGRYEVARISLQTLMNTYDSSEYMAKAKLAIADSWFREGGGNGLAQAEAEYKDFILFYPGMEEAAQAQDRVCDIHYKQMDKSDRDVIQTLRAEDECKALIVQFPNSKFVPAAQQKLREIQESLAEREFDVGDFYHKRLMNPAAANRMNALVDQYPLFSKAGDALYEAGDSYSKMGPRFRKQAGEMFARIVSDYPLSDRVKDATRRLQEMELPVPPVNQAALERAKWEKENYKAPSMLSRSMDLLKGGPDVTHAARSGAPTMTDPKRTMPASIPAPAPDQLPAANGTAGGTTDVTAANATSGALDSKPDARNADGAPKTETASAPAASPAPAAPLPTNRDAELKKLRAEQAKRQAKLEKKKKKTDTAAPVTAAPAGGVTPASTTTPATPSAAEAPKTTPQPPPQQ
jgi:outer membrane protein assembly factor BamD